MKGLFDQLGGREWVRAIGATLDGPATTTEVRLVLPARKKGANRATVTAGRKGGAVKVSFGRVDGDEGEDLGQYPVGTPAEAARLIERELGFTAEQQPPAEVAA